MEGLDRYEVILASAQEQNWKKIFENEKTNLSYLLRKKYIAIEHVGSTSIPGIMAKPIVDIAIGVKFLNKEIVSIKQILEENGYQFCPNHGENGRFFFIKTCGSRRTHHIHVEEYGSAPWKNHIDFRNCLLNHEELKKQYMQLKICLAEKYPMDRDRYTQEKAAFIQKILSSYRMAVYSSEGG